MRAGIDSVSAARLLERALGDDRLRPCGPLRVLAAGKAAHAMAATAARVLEGSIRAGLVISHVDSEIPRGFNAMRGNHPVPDADSERAGGAARSFAASIRSEESFLVLLSGGGSAIMALPADDVALDDKRRTTDRLLKAGADIYALNTVRKHISGIKGGWLAAQTSRPVVTLAISDVVGDDLSVIASGPTVADSSTFSDAISVLTRFGGLEAYPPPVVARLRAGIAGRVIETPKPGDARLAFATAAVIGGRRDAMDGAARAAASRGYTVVQVDEPVVGEARVAALAHLERALGVASDVPHPVCVVSSGETVVQVTGRGKGGRNQEFALAVVERLSEIDRPIVVASAGTDGIDGPTDAAGAVADVSSLNRAEAASLHHPTRYQSNNDAYTFFQPLGDLIMTGPTDTNVGDLQIILIG